MKRVIGVFAIALAVALLSGVNSCGDSSCLMTAHAHETEAVCDTTSFTDRGGTERVTIRCVSTVFDTVVVVDSVFVDCDTVFVASDPDTVFVIPDFACVEECMEAQPPGLGHWRDCLAACIEAR